MFERNPRVTAFIRIALVVVVSCIVSAEVVAQDLEGQSSRDWKLLLASEKGDVKQVRMMLDLGASPVCHDQEFGGTPLHWAAYRGHVKTVEVLLNRGADINATNKDGRPALILAAAMGQAPVVTLLIERGADPEAKGLDGLKAEEWAQHWDRTAVLRLFHPDAAKVAEKLGREKPGKETRRRSVKRNTQNGPEEMNRALVAAAKKGATEKLKRLLDEGADPNALDNATRSTILNLAASGGHAEVTSLLLEKGADPNLKDESRGITPLMEASGKGLAKVVRMLLDKGADPNAVGPGSKTALILAARKGRAEVVAMLIEAKADTNATDDSGRTALQWAVKNGSTEAAELLLKHKGRLEAVPEPSSQDQTKAEPPQEKAEPAMLPSALEPPEANLTPEAKSKALLDAAGKGRLEDVERLIRAGAEVEAKDENGATPLVVAATTGYIEVAESLVRSGANVNASNAEGLTPLSAAVESGHIAVAELLIKNGADVNARAKDGSTAFDRALRKVSRDMQEMLIQHGATPPEAKEGQPSGEEKPEPGSAEEDKNKTLLDAATKGDIENVRRLLDAGADVNAKGPADVTVLMAAATKGNIEVVKLLVERGADPNAKDPSGKTALVYANEKGSQAVSAFLQSKMAPEEKPQLQEAKTVTGDQPPPGKQRLRAVSPETKSAPQTKPN